MQECVKAIGGCDSGDYRPNIILQGVASFLTLYVFSTDLSH